MSPRRPLTREQQELRDLALRLLDAGHTVFPVDADRTPCVRKYHDPDVVTREAATRWSWYRAARLGWSLPEGVVALDIDVKNGKQGFAHLAELEELLGPLPPTATQATPSGGEHRFFHCDPALVRHITTVWMPDGTKADIDFARHGVLIVFLYDPDVIDQPMAQLPDAWIDHLLLPPEHSSWTPVAYLGDPRPTHELIEQLRTTPQGRRNETLYRTALTLRRQGDWSEDIKAEVVAAARATRLTISEITTTLNSAERKPVGWTTLAENWLTKVKEDQEILARRNRHAIHLVAGVAAELHALHGPGFDLSARDGARRTGLSSSTVAALLWVLRDAYYLHSLGQGEQQARRYELRLPRSNSDIHTEGEGRSTEEDQIIKEDHPETQEVPPEVQNLP